MSGFTAPDETLRVTPNPASVAVYAKILPEYAGFETFTRGATRE